MLSAEITKQNQWKPFRLAERGDVIGVSSMLNVGHIAPASAINGLAARQQWTARWRAALFIDNLLKPVAVPAAGGLLASFFCFFLIVDTLHLTPTVADDVPA